MPLIETNSNNILRVFVVVGTFWQSFTFCFHEVSFFFSPIVYVFLHELKLCTWKSTLHLWWVQYIWILLLYDFFTADEFLMNYKILHIEYPNKNEILSIILKQLYYVPRKKMCYMGDATEFKFLYVFEFSKKNFLRTFE